MLFSLPKQSSLIICPFISWTANLCYCIAIWIYCGWTVVDISKSSNASVILRRRSVRRMLLDHCTYSSVLFMLLSPQPPRSIWSRPWSVHVSPHNPPTSAAALTFFRVPGGFVCQLLCQFSCCHPFHVACPSHPTSHQNCCQAILHFAAQIIHPASVYPPCYHSHALVLSFWDFRLDSLYLYSNINRNVNTNGKRALIR